jgi:hypothetical protein
VSVAGDPNGADWRRANPRIYSLEGVYFDRRWFNSTADCLTAASARSLPLDLCK